MEYQTAYQAWLNDPAMNEEGKAELLSIASDEKAKEYRFGAELEFGTAGMRGIIGYGTNMMNVYTVRRATQGLVDGAAGIPRSCSGGLARLSAAFQQICRQAGGHTRKKTRINRIGKIIKRPVNDDRNGQPQRPHIGRGVQMLAGQACHGLAFGVERVRAGHDGTRSQLALPDDKGYLQLGHPVGDGSLQSRNVAGQRRKGPQVHVPHIKRSLAVK